MPSRVPADIRQRLEPIKAVVLDVDGVLTDSTLWFSGAGEEHKRFSARDGLAIRLLLEAGLELAVLTGRQSQAVTLRCRELGIREELVVQSSDDKAADLDRIEAALGVDDVEVAVIGDDLPDLPALARAGFAACPADAAPEVAAACDLVCGTNGGHGVVREFAEVLLKAQNRWLNVVGKWVGPGMQRR